MNHALSGAGQVLTRLLLFLLGGPLPQPQLPVDDGVFTDETDRINEDDVNWIWGR